MAQLTYNGVTFSMIHVLNYDQEDVYDDASKTDYQYTKVAIKIQAIFSQDPSSALAPSPFPALPPGNDELDANASQTMVRVRQLLRSPRQNLIFTDADVLINTYGVGTEGAQAAAKNPGAQLDVKNGPFPEVVSITQFVGTVTYMVTFAVTTYIIEPCINSANTVLTHRWSETQSIDKFWTTTLRRTGVLVIATQLNKQGADQLGRSQTWFPLRVGFTRTKQDFILSEDGLALRYTIEDQQLFRMPPQGAIEAEGTVTKSTFGATRGVANIQISLKGAVSPPDLNNVVPFSQSTLGSLAVWMGVTQANYIFDQSTNGTGWLKRAALTYGIWENTVKLAMEIEYAIPDYAVMKNFPISPAVVLTNWVVNGQYVAPLYYEATAGVPISPTPGNKQSFDSQPASKLYLVYATLGIPCKAPPSGNQSAG